LKISILITLLLFISISVYAQPITFTDVTNNYSLPAGVKLIKGQRTTNPKLALWYFDVDMNRSDVAIKPYLNPVGKEGLTSFVTRLGAFAGLMEAILIQALMLPIRLLLNPELLEQKILQQS
jgi:hypothetical protein